jgi:hypothetical protein
MRTLDSPLREEQYWCLDKDWAARRQSRCWMRSACPATQNRDDGPAGAAPASRLNFTGCCTDRRVRCSPRNLRRGLSIRNTQHARAAQQRRQPLDGRPQQDRSLTFLYLVCRG